MRHLDFSPLFRSTIGFDRVFNLLDNMTGAETNGSSYPPYNIERTGENAYRITMAVAGFSEQDLTIESHEQSLIVTGERSDQPDKSYEMLHHGIAARSFERRFQLADYVEVKGASLENGLLHVDLVREIPEAMKPRQIKINAEKNTPKQIEASVA